jgi:carbamoyltransferase
MNILGLYPMGPNTASCLQVDGKIVASAEEERFVREKLATDKIPVRSSKYCLKEGGLTLDEVDAITIGWDNNKYPKGMKKFYSSKMNHPAKDNYSKIYEEISLNQKNPIFFNKRIEMSFRRAGFFGIFPKIFYYNHHQCHAYSIYYPSPYKEAIILVIDGSGEELATSIWVAKNKIIKLKNFLRLPNSLGYFYGAITEYLGFQIFRGEGKLMGLAAYGRPDKKIKKALNKIIWIDGEDYKVNPEYIYFSKRSYSLRFTDKLVKLLGRKPRKPETGFDNWHKNLAWETQNKLEEIVKHLVLNAINKYKIRNICISGGVAMNCKLVGEVANLPEVRHCFVGPDSKDTGCARGSAIVHEKNKKKVWKEAKKFSVYSGPQYNNSLVLDNLREANIKKFKRLSFSKIYEYTAESLKKGKIIGWFQGRMEVGARALGNRSILANPALKGIKNKVNSKVKHREKFRPFAPAILEEKCTDYFEFPNQDILPHHSWMAQAVYSKPGFEKLLSAVVHVDGSVRPQVVSEASNRKFYFLIKSFYKKTGVPVLLNTSFNVRGEPIVCSPFDAIRCFYSTGLDILVMNNFLIEK